MNKRILLAATFGIALFGILPTMVYAQDTSSGCGLGWMVTQRNSLVSSWVRASTNVTFSNTIAMTFGTSGCSRHDLVLNEKSAEYFVEANYDRLRREMAEGQGEFLSAFAEVLGCDAGSMSEFANAVQSQYGSIFDHTPSADEVLQRTRVAISVNPELAFRCQNVRLAANY